MYARLAAALAIGLAAATAAVPLAAHEYELGALAIDHPWARASAGAARNGAAFMAISNRGSEADRLLSASSPAAARVELHTHIMDSDGVMKMRQMEAIELPAGAETRLAPGGLHLMLMGLTAPLVEGTSFPATLTFERAGEITVEVAVEGVAAMGGEAGDAGHHGTQGGMDHDMDMQGGGMDGSSGN